MTTLFNSPGQAEVHARSRAVTRLDDEDAAAWPADFSQGPVDEMGTHVGCDPIHGPGVTVPWFAEADAADPTVHADIEAVGWVTVYSDGEVSYSDGEVSR
jgi:hypothetical protein